MRVFTVLLLSTIVAISCTPTPKSGAEAEAELKAVDDKFVEAFTKKDVDAIVALYAEDAIGMFPGDQLWSRGHDEIRQAMTELFANCSSPNLTLHDATYRLTGNLGYGVGLFDMSCMDVQSGQMMQMQGRWSTVFEKRGGKWVYVADHASHVMPEGAAPGGGEHPAGADTQRSGEHPAGAGEHPRGAEEHPRPGQPK